MHCLFCFANYVINFLILQFITWQLTFGIPRLEIVHPENNLLPPTYARSHLPWLQNNPKKHKANFWYVLLLTFLMSLCFLSYQTYLFEFSQNSDISFWEMCNRADIFVKRGSSWLTQKCKKLAAWYQPKICFPKNKQVVNSTQNLLLSFLLEGKTLIKN